ncbi:MAG: tetratricopeptide repeat protein [Myxococcota bacterium]|nr:tetratricopeptide repeat protein [Myxococcota bacterium]
MTRPREAASPASAEDFLRLALAASDASSRARLARRGLALDSSDLDPDTQVLLLRQIYLSHLDARRFRKAAEVAEQMSKVGAMKDIAQHDLSRALAAVGDLDAAIEAQRAAARNAPADRRSFQQWSLGTLQHWAGDIDAALRSLARAERWSTRGRPMVRAHIAYVRLSSGLAAPDLDRTITDLQKSPSREGYGQWLLGMIAYELGDKRKAAVHLRAWLRRHAAPDEAKTITLREELRRARVALAEIESD